MNKNLCISFLTLCACALSNSHAIELVLSAQLDSSIFEDNVDNSSSLGDFIFVGTTGDRNGAGPSFRRGLIRFDIAGNLPSNATIQNASLILTIGKVPDEKFVGTTQSIHRVTTVWGATNTALADPDNKQGNGVPAQDGEATWNEAIRGTTNWSNPGGDYNSLASASNGVSPVANSEVVWSDLGLINDIQLWLDTPSVNLGWIVIGNESFTKNARGYYSMDNTDLSAAGRAPRLTIEYTLVPEAKNAASILGGLALLVVLIKRKYS
jgi:hypothetical protein